jgi:hypothetical protein
MVTLTEDELDVLVSAAIHRAELLDDARSPLAKDAWQEVMTYEERLAAITSPGDVLGGVARAGAVSAALAAGLRRDAERLATRYLAEDSLPSERRDTIGRMLQQAGIHIQENGSSRAVAHGTNGTTVRPSSGHKSQINVNRP